MSNAAAEVGKSGLRKRQSWTLEEKRVIVEERFEDGASGMLPHTTSSSELADDAALMPTG
jgi:hypothetical protein